jgi:dipeptidyl aminopeptidase/acylaminoacyl peptidase
MKKPAILPRLASTAMVVAAMLMAIASAAHAGLPALIPREVLFGNPERAQPTISPDGKKLAWIAPDSKNVMQVWVQTIGGNDARMMTADRSRGIGNYDWAWDSQTLLYQQDSDGDENYHTYAVDLASGNVRDLTPWQGVRAEVIASNPKFPDQLLIAMNLRDRKTMDVYRLKLKSGAVALDTLNPGDAQGWLADDDLVIRGASIVTSEGGSEILVRDSGQAKWRTIVKTGAGDLKQDMVGMLDFSKDGRAIFLESTVGSDTAGIVRKDLSSGAETLIVHRDDSDLDDAMIHPTRHVVEAAAFAPDRKHWQVIDASVAPDFAALAKVDDGDLSIVSRDLADDTWLVSFNSDRHSGHYYQWDRATHKATLLFRAQPRLDAATLAPKKPVTFRARDGMKIHGYLTLPVGVEPKNLALVENVHGGPWWRDSWGMDPLAQWYANRGYAALEVNFRGSTGYGKKYLHAGDRQWGRAMQDDLTDGVKWAARARNRRSEAHRDRRRIIRRLCGAGRRGVYLGCI